MTPSAFLIPKNLIALAVAVFFSNMNIQAVIAQTNPERAILFIIDGMHTEAPERLNMNNFLDLTEEGALIEKTCTIMPYHPTQGPYAEVHTCSYPNPVLMAGTIFLEPGQAMIQDQFQSSAFVANTGAYQSITPGFEYVIQKSEPDKFSVDQAVELLKNNTIDFMRVHLQNAGSAGSQSLGADDDQPYKHNIWHEDAPYVSTIREADRQLGRFIEALKAMDKWEGTLLIVSSDHGQTKTGWHPRIPEESWVFPTVITGPGIKQGLTVERADHTDIVPTIAHLMGVPIPNEDGGSGKVLEYIQQGHSIENKQGNSNLVDFNRVLKRYQIAEAKLMSNAEEHPNFDSRVIRAERDFYGLPRIMQWHEMDSIEKLNQNNLEIVKELERLLAGMPDK